MLNKLEQLEDNLVELNKLNRTHSRSDFQSNKALQWSLRYGLMESIQIVIDLSCHIASKDNLGSPQTDRECIELLKKFDYLPEALADKLVAMVGLRNLLVHEYFEIDMDQLYQFLNRLDDFQAFVGHVRAYL